MYECVFMGGRGGQIFCRGVVALCFYESCSCVQTAVKGDAMYSSISYRGDVISQICACISMCTYQYCKVVDADIRWEPYAQVGVCFCSTRMRTPAAVLSMPSPFLQHASAAAAVDSIFATRTHMHSCSCSMPSPFLQHARATRTGDTHQLFY